MQFSDALNVDATGSSQIDFFFADSAVSAVSVFLTSQILHRVISAAVNTCSLFPCFSGEAGYAWVFFIFDGLCTVLIFPVRLEEICKKNYVCGVNSSYCISFFIGSFNSLEVENLVVVIMVKLEHFQKKFDMEKNCLMIKKSVIHDLLGRSCLMHCGVHWICESPISAPLPSP